VTASTVKMTARQFHQLGVDPEGVRLELVDGEISVSPSPTFYHSHAVLELAVMLKVHIVAENFGILLADVDTVLSDHDVRRPDILFVRRARQYLITPQGVMGPPDLCVEVVSPTSSVIDRTDKFVQYARAGVEFYWIVDTADQKFEAYRVGKKPGAEWAEYVLGVEGRGSRQVSAEPFPALTLDLGRLWWPA